MNDQKLWYVPTEKEMDQLLEKLFGKFWYLNDWSVGFMILLRCLILITLVIVLGGMYREGSIVPRPLFVYAEIYFVQIVWCLVLKGLSYI